MKLKKLQFEHKGKKIELTPEEARGLYTELKKHFADGDTPITLPYIPPYTPSPNPITYPWETAYVDRPIHITTTGDSTPNGGGPSTCLKN